MSSALPGSSGSSARTTRIPDRGTVHPDVRRRGIGTALLGWNLARARVRASREDPLVRVELAAFSEDSEIGQRALLDNAGFKTVRHFFLMRRQGLDDIPDAPLPDGIESARSSRNSGGRSWLRRTRPSATTGVIAKRVRATSRGRSSVPSSTLAYGSSPGTATRSRASSRTGSGPRRTSASASSAAGSRTSASGGRGAARARPGDHRGVTGQVPEVGLKEAMLGVDSQNPNGAGLYEGLGSPRQPRSGLPARPDPLTGHANRRRRRGRAPSRPVRGRSSWPGRGQAGRRRGLRARQAGDRGDHRASSPPGRSVRPHAPAKRVSPLNRTPSSSSIRQTEPSVWPGVWRTRRRIWPKAMTPPSASSTAGTDGGMSNGA